MYNEDILQLVSKKIITGDINLNIIAHDKSEYMILV